MATTPERWSGNTAYNNCSWGPKLDRDGDGIPCEGIC
ncbi:excalibur calcium-binding domain-containing protein [Mesorhizobium sp.]